MTTARPTALDRIESILRTGPRDLLDDAIDAFSQSSAPVPSDRSIDICTQLRAERHFTLLLRFADAVLERGGSDAHWTFVVQALLDQRALRSAEAAVRHAVTSVEDHVVLATLQGHLGRINKDRFLTTREPHHLVAAIDAYRAGLDRGGDRLWLGVNALALAHLGRRHGIEVGGLDPVESSELFRAAEERSREGDPWATATLVGASLIVGLPVPTDTIATRLVDASGFIIGSLMRDLREVWELPDDHPAIVTLAELALRKGGGADVALPVDEAGYEKMFGTEWPVPIETYRQGMFVAGSICHLLLGERYPAGTGFAMHGSDLHPLLAGRRVIVTNEHVVPRLERDGLRAEELTARFEANGQTNVCDLRPVWWSDRTDLDITLLVSDELDASDIRGLTPAKRLPIVRAGAHVYVVGHPGGGGIQLSIRGNDLIDHDDVRLHYLAPTSKGSSGSPVFDHDWNLIGVHHFGSPTLAALHGRPGTYDGNQGSTIAAVKQQLQERPPTP